MTPTIDGLMMIMDLGGLVGVQGVSHQDGPQLTLVGGKMSS